MKRRFGRSGWKNPLGLRPKLLTKKTWNIRRIIRTLVSLAGAGLLILVFLFAWYSRSLPTPGKIQKHHSAEATQIFDRNGKPLYAVFGEEKRLPIASDQIPTIAKQATIAIEDKDFYKHFGIDLSGLVRGVIVMPLTGHRAAGGSTITQQYVKNALLSPDRTFDRKIKELILSLELEVMFDKDEILTLYLNEIPYGSNAYGIESAAQSFFGKAAKDLTLPEAATLAALPQRPSYLSPYGNHTDELKIRRDYTLKRMNELGFITTEEATAAQATDLTFIPRRDAIVAPHFVFYIRDQLIEKYGEQLVLEGGLKVTTTLDLTAQDAAEAAVTKAADNYLESYEADNAALVAIDPKTGQILAMVGSADYFNEENGKYNVTTGKRQPGSSFKPLVYATGLKGRWNPTSTLWDVETDFGNYIPQNYDGSFRGPVTIRAALANSLNIPAVKMLALAGIEDAIETARDMGITTLNEPDRYGLSLVLGGAEVKPLELAGAYGVFAAGGDYHTTSGILKVEDSRGRILEEWKDQSKRVLAPEIAYQITDILSDNAARAPVFGSNSPLFFRNRTVAAKTGTTQEYRDAWTAGYTPSVAAVVWAGNSDYTPMNRSGGVRAAAPIFHDFLVNYLGDNPNEEFPQPDGLKQMTVDAISGKIPTEHSPQTLTDWFASWQIPTEKDDVHVSLNVNKLNGKVATDLTPPDLIETRVYSRIHSEKPTSPFWEDPVLSWARGNGYVIEDPPTEKDDYSSDQLPTIRLLSPTKDTAVSGFFRIEAAAEAPTGIRSVSFLVDDVTVEQKTAGPWIVNYNADTLAVGNHEIAVMVTDQLGAQARAETVVVAVRTPSSPSPSGTISTSVSPTTKPVSSDRTPPGPVTNVAIQVINSSSVQTTRSVQINWTNPGDSDLARVRIYRSTTPNQLGTLIDEVTAQPGNEDQLVIQGQTIGLTYYFTLRPIDTSENETPTTNQASITVL